MLRQIRTELVDDNLTLVAAGVAFYSLLALFPGAERRYDGPMGKSDRAFVFGALALLLGLGVPGEPWVAWVTWAVAALAALTVANRVRAALRERAAAAERAA